MPAPHQIRLIGPWEICQTPQEPNAQWSRIKLPAPWSDAPGNEFRSMNFRRKFNWLANLTPDETVHIVFAGYGGTGSVRVNEHPLGLLDGRPAEFEITQMLEPSNYLFVDLEFDQQLVSIAGGLWGPVILEVRTPDDGPVQEKTEPE